jgi:hypothetical protein
MVLARRALSVLVALAILTWPAGALAQGGSPNPLTPHTPQPQVPATTTTISTTTAATSTSGGGLSGADGVAIGVGALLVLGGISFFIWRDARKRAPVRPATAAADGGSGPRQRQKQRKLSPAERKRRKRGRAR